MDNINMSRVEARNADTFENVLARITHLERAESLLSRIYAERGPYGDGKITDKTWEEIKNHFHFDDGE